MSMAPFAMMKARYGYRMGSPMGKSELVDTMVIPFYVNGTIRNDEGTLWL
jgi:hypothetical protein